MPETQGDKGREADAEPPMEAEPQMLLVFIILSKKSRHQGQYTKNHQTKVNKPGKAVQFHAVMRNVGCSHLYSFLLVTREKWQMELRH
jgi:hypothetical protein